MRPPWRLEWGPAGARAAADRGDVLVAVDVLSFSTCVATAASRGIAIHPCPWNDDPAAFARRLGPGVDSAVRREEVPERGRWSLSLLTFERGPAGAAVVLASPNGARCAAGAARCPAVLAGALVNATATARAALALDHPVTVLACGERSGDGIRFAVEDLLGAGAILAAAGAPRTAEADVATAAFEGVAHVLERILLECESGLELAVRGHTGDVRHAARLDASGVAAGLVEGRFARI